MSDNKRLSPGLRTQYARAVSGVRRRCEGLSPRARYWIVALMLSLLALLDIWVLTRGFSAGQRIGHIEAVNILEHETEQEGE